MNQRERWGQATAIRREVKTVLGSDLSHEFRSNQTYQNYTGVCGEVLLAYQDGELDDQLIDLLTEYADKVISLKQQEDAKQDNRVANS